MMFARTLCRPQLRPRRSPGLVLRNQSQTPPMLSSESSNPTKKPPPSPRKKKIIIGRLPSRYHLFCVQEVKRLNDALPKGQKRLLIGDPDGVRALRERWMAMSEEERVSATETAYQEAVARIKAHSGKTTRQIGNIQWLLEGLKEYKELEYALVILRRSEKEPMVFQSSHYVEGFWKEKFQSSLQDIAKAMQIHTYKAKGMRPLAKDMSIEHIRELLAKFSNDPKDTIRDVNGVPLDYAFMPDVYDVQRATHELMSQKLREATRRPGTRPMRVQYRIFDEAITKRYGVTIEGWPAVRFGNTFSNVRDSLTLYLAWRSGEARFRKLTSVEKKLWDMTRERLKEERVGSYTSEEIEAARQIHLYWIEYDNKVIGTIGQIAMFMDAPFATLRKWRESGDPRGFGCRPKMGGKTQDKLDTLSSGGIALPAHSR